MKTSSAIVIAMCGLALASVAGEASRTNAPVSVAPQLEIRFFKMDTNVFYANLRKSQASVTNETNWELLREFFKRQGVDLYPPSAFWLNDRTGMLMVRAKPGILTNIPPVVEKLNARK
jgi:hypothetical protein